MSTRTQIEFIVKAIDDGKEFSEKRTVYQHSDGYPSWTIPNLLDFLYFNQGRNEDIEYITANFIYHGKKGSEKYLNSKWSNDKKRKKWNDPDHNSSVKIGYGVCLNDQYHSDIEYLYKVIVDCSRSNEPDSFFLKDDSLKIKVECYSADTYSSSKPIFSLLHSFDIPKGFFDLNKKVFRKTVKDFEKKIETADQEEQVKQTKEEKDKEIKSWIENTKQKIQEEAKQE